MTIQAAKSRAIYVPETVWGKLASIADDRGVTVSDLVTSSIIDIMQPVSTRERVRQMVMQGMPDGAISERLKVSLAQVAVHRRSVGLRANYSGRSGGGAKA